MEEIEVRIPSTPRVRRNYHMWGLGIYVNVDHYRYIAAQVGPWYVYLYTEEPQVKFERKTSRDKPNAGKFYQRIGRSAR
jgi:hypothetical protein